MDDDLPSATDLTRSRLPVDNMEFRSLRGVDHVIVDGRQYPRLRVFLIGRLARAVNLRIIGCKTIEMNEAAVEEAASFDPNYQVDETHAMQLTPISSSKPLLVLCSDEGQVALLDGRQRSFKNFREGHSLVKAHELTLQEALTFGLHPLSGDLNILYNQYRNTPHWDTIKALLKDLGNFSQLTPLIDILLRRVEEHGLRDLRDSLEKLAVSLGEGHMPLVGHQLLQSVRHDPIIYGGERGRSEPEHRFVVQLAEMEPSRRIALSADAERLHLFFQLFCLELVLTGCFLANMVPGRPRAFEDLRKWFEGTGKREKLAEAGQAYLRQMWVGMGLETKPISRFNVILQNAGATLTKISGRVQTLSRFREQINLELDQLRQQNNAIVELGKVYQAKIKIVKTFCQAHIRARQWASAKHFLMQLDDRFERLIEIRNRAHQAAHDDPDDQETLLDLNGLVLISSLSGTIATEIYPHLAKYNSICEAWAYLFWRTHDVNRAAAYLTPTLVETWINRESLEKTGQRDRVSPMWDDIFNAYRCAGFDSMFFRRAHLAMDEQRALDEWDRGMLSHLH